MNYTEVAPGCPQISQGFGCTDFIYEWYRPSCPPPHRWHDGIDWAGPNCCGTPLLAAGDGFIQAIGTTWPGSDGLGPGAMLLHMTDGNYAGYGHGYAEVSVGQNVRKGDRIGRVGTQGNSTGCHLHLLIGSTYGPVPMGDINPLTYEGPGSVTPAPPPVRWRKEKMIAVPGRGGVDYYGGIGEPNIGYHVFAPSSGAPQFREQLPGEWVEFITAVNHPDGTIDAYGWGLDGRVWSVNWNQGRGWTGPTVTV